VLLAAMVGCSSGTSNFSAASSAKSIPAGSSKQATATPTPSSQPTPPAPPPPPAPTTSAACAGTPATIQHIYVSIGQQHLWACTGDTLLTDTVVTTGASALKNVHDATPTGTFRITGKVRDTVLAGHDVNGAWHDAVTYWMPFSGGIGFHDSPWQTFPLGSPLYTTQGSHGCIHLPLDTIKVIFAWAATGTLVTIRN
jgi:lipoprotein-anchoring transpeptidase ErfK/SrfK